MAEMNKMQRETSEQPFSIGDPVRLKGCRDEGAAGTVAAYTWDKNVKVHWDDLLEGEYAPDALLLDKPNERTTKMSTTLLYSNSPVPPRARAGLAGDKTEINVSADGKTLDYPSTAATGFVEIEIPNPRGSVNATERLHARDFGAHVAAAIERTFTTQPYLRGTGLGPVETFGHYSGAAKGLKLLSDSAQRNMDTLLAKFAAASNPTEFFKTDVRPFLHGLTPGKR